MGWTSYNAWNYKQVAGRTTVDRKAECDRICNDSCNAVLKSAMVGTVYYAAVKRFARWDWNREKVIPLPDNEHIVYAVVFVTSVNMKEYDNFSYKDMDETVLPYYYDCPVSILKLLSPTDCERAKQWREKCYEKLAKKKEKATLSSLPIGAVISYTTRNGEVRLQKHAPAYQFKRPFWMIVGKHKYMPTKRIPDDYTIVA